MLDRPPTGPPDLSALREISVEAGADLLIVQAGGGNTSVKVDPSVMWIKASGARLREADGVDAFVAVRRNDVLALLHDDALQALPRDQRESQVTTRLMATKLEDVAQRPSIETFLHALLPWKYVVHTHPVYVNAIGCVHGGAALLEDWLGDDGFAWVDYAKPGLDLGLELQSSTLRYRQSHANEPRIIVLANHGLIVGGDDLDDIREHTHRIMATLRQRLGDLPSPTYSPPSSADADALRTAILEVDSAEPVEVQWTGNPVSAAVATNSQLSPMLAAGALYPDHVVYLGRLPLRVAAGQSTDSLIERVRSFAEQQGYLPRFAMVENTGVLVVGRNTRELENREEMLACHAQTLCLLPEKHAPAFLTEEQCHELMEWEWEEYRAGLA